MGYKLTPIEIQYSLDLEGDGSRCSSISGYQEVMDLNFAVTKNVNECAVGIFGLIANQFFGMEEQSFYDCQWREYTPQLPIRSIPLALSQFDREYQFKPYSCNDFSELSNDSYFDDD